MIYVFIVDTSASMNQIFSHGLSYLDCAKSGIEHFFQAAIHDSIPQLLKELKTLTATDISNPGQAFNAAFDYLNAYRYQAGLETHGKGRYFTGIESTVIMWFTDGGNLSFIDHGTNKCIVQNRPLPLPLPWPILCHQLQISGLRTPGAAVYAEPFRWDQKLHTFLLSPEGKLVHPEIAAMSNATHSEVYAIWTKDHMKRCIENCMGAHKPPHPDVFPQSASVTQTTVWPIRSAIPLITCTTEEFIYTIPHGFPYDRFNIEQGPFKALLARKPGVCWTLFVKNSGKAEGLGEPIGFLKVSAASRGSGVMMYIMPYNFPKLFKLIEHLNKNPSMKGVPPPAWTKNFRTYLTEIPPYYHAKLKTMMGRIGLEHLFPASLVPSIHEWPITTYGSTVMQQAKIEFEKYVSSVAQKIKTKAEEVRRINVQKSEVVDAENLVENAFDVSRSHILIELKLLQTHFSKASTAQQGRPQIQKLIRDQDYQDALHSVPISEMSNHHSKPYTPPLRNPFESDEDILRKAKRDPFGNPWVTKTKTPPSSTPTSPILPPVSTEDDEISNEASLMSGSSNDIADAAKLAADLENVAAHARKFPRRRTRSNNTSPSSRSSEYSESLAGSTLDGSVTSSLRSDRFVLDRVPNLVDYFPVLVLPPPCSYQEVESGVVDISAWVEKFRLDAKAKKAEADELERVKELETVAQQNAASILAWRADSVVVGNGGGVVDGVVPMVGVEEAASFNPAGKRVSPPHVPAIPASFQQERSAVSETVLELVSSPTSTSPMPTLPKGMRIVKKSSSLGGSDSAAVPPGAVDDFDARIETAFRDSSAPSSAAGNAEPALVVSRSSSIKRDSSGRELNSAGDASQKPRRLPSIPLDPQSSASSTSSTKSLVQSERRLSDGEAKRQRLDPRLEARGKVPEVSNLTAARRESGLLVSGGKKSSIPSRRDPRPLSAKSVTEATSTEPENYSQADNNNETLMKNYTPDFQNLLAGHNPNPTPSSSNKHGHPQTYSHSQQTRDQTRQPIQSQPRQTTRQQNHQHATELRPTDQWQQQPQQGFSGSSSRAPQRPPTPAERTLPFNTRAWTSKLMPKVANTKGKGKYDTNSVCLHYNLTQCGGNCGFEHVCAVCAKLDGRSEKHTALGGHHSEYFA
ncbi:UNVERIFIED_CONTAM: Integrator complex subunit 6 [Siphonaria sp. JEL0065]|nr:Integrator complex subunit 6 [Siphonaria sp. JEL0065]